MVKTEGAYVQRDVYGLQRISTDLSADTDALDNIDTDIAVNDITKLFYHQNRIGSTAYTTLRDATVISYTTYNEWGEVQTDERLGTNYAGIDNIHDFTGHNYDKVLDKHFAQYRMYDAALKRFMSEDPAEDGTNWYAYAKNNPATYVDLLGLKYSRSYLQGALDDIRRGSSYTLVKGPGYTSFNLSDKDNVSDKATDCIKEMLNGVVWPYNYFSEKLEYYKRYKGLGGGAYEIGATTYKYLMEDYLIDYWVGRPSMGKGWYPADWEEFKGQVSTIGEPATPLLNGFTELNLLLSPRGLYYYLWNDRSKVTIRERSSDIKLQEIAFGNDMKLVSGEVYVKPEYLFKKLYGAARPYVYVGTGPGPNCYSYAMGWSYPANPGYIAQITLPFESEFVPVGCLADAVEEDVWVYAEKMLVLMGTRRLSGVYDVVTINLLKTPKNGNLNGFV